MNKTFQIGDLITPKNPDWGNEITIIVKIEPSSADRNHDRLFYKNENGQLD